MSDAQAVTVFEGELTDTAPVGTAIGTVDGRHEPVRVPASRYVSADFAVLEHERLWPHVWQIACPSDLVRNPGDYYDHTIGLLSVVIVRGTDGILRAFQNVCGHRGNELCHGSGEGLTELRCGYHRWCWDLEGRLREVPSRKGFGVLRNDDYGLAPVRVGEWSGLVWVNLDPGTTGGTGAEPLDEFLEALPSDTAWARADEYVCRAVITTALPCNWKTGIDAFSETYHVQGIHREMIPSTDDVNSLTRIWGRHGSLTQPYGIPSPRLRHGATPQEIWESYWRQQGERIGVSSRDEPDPHPPIPHGHTIRDVIEERLRATARAGGSDVDGFTSEQVMSLYQYNVFPNVTLLYLVEGFTVLRMRPGATPDDCWMDVMSYKRVSDPGARAAQPRPIVMTVPADQAPLGLVFSQDIANLQRVQRGLHQPAFTHLTLSHEERRITNLHRNLERYLAIEPTEITGGQPWDGQAWR
jgi:choline monooxygenase